MLPHRAGKANIPILMGANVSSSPGLHCWEMALVFQVAIFRIYGFDLICLKRDPRGTGCLN